MFSFSAWLKRRRLARIKLEAATNFAAYVKKKNLADDLNYALKAISNLVEKPHGMSGEEIVQALRDRRSAVMDEERARQNERAKKMGLDFVPGDTIRNDEEMMLERAANAVAFGIAKVSLDGYQDLITATAEANQIFKRSLEAIIDEAIMRLDSIRHLACKPRPDWESAGDVWMSIWETHLIEGVKHAILENIASYNHGGIKLTRPELDQALSQQILDIEKRIESERKAID